MITEDYCSFEIAKLLKEKGFDETCYACYEYFSSGVTMYSGWPFEYKGEPVHNTNDRVKCPTHQMALKWLREVHNIIIYIKPLENGNCYVSRILYNGIDSVVKGGAFGSYEQAVKVAILYVLKNLI